MLFYGEDQFDKMNVLKIQIQSLCVFDEFN